MILASGVGDQPIKRRFLEIKVITIAVYAVAAKHKFFKKSYPGANAGVVEND